MSQDVDQVLLTDLPGWVQDRFKSLREGEVLHLPFCDGQVADGDRDLRLFYYLNGPDSPLPSPFNNAVELLQSIVDEDMARRWEALERKENDERAKKMGLKAAGV